VIKHFWTRIKALYWWVHRKFEGTSTRAVALRWILAIFLFLGAIIFLILLSWLLRGAGLWGDLAFAIVVTTGVFWIARRILTNLLDEGPVRALLCAFSTTIFVLVGVPVAYVTRPVGVLLLLLPIVVWAAFQIFYGIQGRKKKEVQERGEEPVVVEQPKEGQKRRKRRFPTFWEAEVAGVGLLAIVLLVAPAVGSVDRVPKAVPEASTEGGEQDLAVAEAFRPVLFFDSGEQRFPMDIDAAIAENRVQMCRKAVGEDSCELVESAGSIDENRDYLELEEAPGTPRGGGEASAIYYRVTRPDENVYVDYWWFYSRNPSPVADKVFCGPGLRTPPFTCQEHSGDWEGLTVVLASCAEGAPDCQAVGDQRLAPEEIRYGQHEHVVAYDWNDALTPLWGSLTGPSSGAYVETWRDVVLPAVQSAGVHAVAFVARNSHASYPTPCFGKCEQQTRALPEARHDGVVPWVHNDSCDDGCVHPLPLTTNGDPALWNAFPGRWGEQKCILGGAYCDLSGAPKGPSFQKRYKEPDGEVDEYCLSGGRRLVRC
jgi:hypothetical protein